MKTTDLRTKDEAGLQAEDVEIRKADLEDVFLDVMSGEATGAQT